MGKVIEKKTLRNIPILDLTWFFVFIYLLWWGMEIIINNFTNTFQANYFSLMKLFVLGLVSQIGLNIAPSIFFCKLKKLNIKRILKLNLVSTEQFILSFILFLSFNGIALFLDNLMNIVLSWFSLSYKMNNYIFAKDIFTLIVLILVAGILTPLCEELFYRGFLLSCTERIGVRLSIIYSAACFSIMHTNPYRLSSLFVYSIFIGLIVYYTNSTLPGVIFHILNNTIYEIGSYFSRGDLVTTSIIIENNKGSNFISRKLIFCGIIFLICSVISYVTIRRLKDIWIKNNSITDQRGISVIKEPSPKREFCISMVIFVLLFIIKVKLYH